MKRIIGILLSLALLVALSSPVLAANTVKLNMTEISLKVGETYKLKVKGASGFKWKTSNKKVATVNQNGKVTAKGDGNCTVAAVKGDQKYKCRVHVFERTAFLTSARIKDNPTVKDKTNSLEKMLKKTAEVNSVENILKDYPAYYECRSEETDVQRALVNEKYITKDECIHILPNMSFYANSEMGYAITDTEQGYFYTGRKFFDYYHLLLSTGDELQPTPYLCAANDREMIICKRAENFPYQLIDDKVTTINAKLYECQMVYDVKTHLLKRIVEFIYTDDSSAPRRFVTRYDYDEVEPALYSAFKGLYNEKVYEKITVTFVIEPDTENEMTVKKSIPKNKGIVTKFPLLMYYSYSDRACTKYFDDSVDVTKDFTVYLKAIHS